MNNHSEPIGFSVIIPLFNKGSYILRAVQSVLAQQYSRFEIIVVDDGSTDDGPDRVRGLTDKAITLVSQPNSGVSKARNTGASLAKYHFLAFLDADDTWEPDLLLVITELITLYPTAGLYGTNFIFRYPDDSIFLETFDNFLGNQSSGIIPDFFSAFANYGRSPFCNSSCCIPKQIFTAEGGYMEGVSLTEDSDLWCRIALKHDLAFSTKPLATYYLNTEGSTHLKFEAQEFQVATTLDSCINKQQVQPHFINSVNKLIAFQKMNLIKRAIMSKHKWFALSKFSDNRLWIYYPLSGLMLLISLLIPIPILKYLNRLRR